jgi:hypothetical protein
MTRPLLSIIIVSYNTREMTLDCLRTLQSELAGLTSRHSSSITHPATGAWRRFVRRSLMCRCRE